MPATAGTLNANWLVFFNLGLLADFRVDVPMIPYARRPGFQRIASFCSGWEPLEANRVEPPGGPSIGRRQVWKNKPSTATSPTRI